MSTGEASAPALEDTLGEQGILPSGHLKATVVGPKDLVGGFRSQICGLWKQKVVRNPRLIQLRTPRNPAKRLIDRPIRLCGRAIAEGTTSRRTVPRRARFLGRLARSRRRISAKALGGKP